jgi:hypothetical protein
METLDLGDGLPAGRVRWRRGVLKTIHLVTRIVFNPRDVRTKLSNGRIHVLQICMTRDKLDPLALEDVLEPHELPSHINPA